MIIVVILYVDDAIFMGNNPKFLMDKKKQFMKIWECRDLGPVSEHLRMGIICNRHRRILIIDQIDYANKIVKHFWPRKL